MKEATLDREALFPFSANPSGEKPAPACGKRAFGFGALATQDTFELSPPFERII